MTKQRRIPKPRKIVPSLTDPVFSDVTLEEIRKCLPGHEVTSSTENGSIPASPQEGKILKPRISLLQAPSKDCSK